MPLDLIVITNNIYTRKQKIDLVKIQDEKKRKKEKRFRYYFCECVLYRKK